MDILTEGLVWLGAHPRIVIGLSVFSVLMFIGTLIALPWLITRIPPDYFAPPHRKRSRFAHTHPVLRWDLLILRNLVGLLLLLAGMLMLFMPGQGLLTLLAGLILMNYPGKYRLERWLIQRPALLRAVNALRVRRGAEPLEF
ncbi:PGPGW domain-containing protein [Thiofaba sp. EF100]|uniref:PGPGW domain-containing protein n=1 Tax=Thiofaba sp. EF100 TaxID=3121274 RepID=UPI003221554E